MGKTNGVTYIRRASVTYKLKGDSSGSVIDESNEADAGKMENFESPVSK